MNQRNLGKQILKLLYSNKNSICLFVLFCGINSCTDKNYFSFKNGTIDFKSTIRIEYYSAQDFSAQDSLRKPKYILTNKAKIKKLIEEINLANDPQPWKGAAWDKICIVQTDTTYILGTNGKVIGCNYSIGDFYKLKDEFFISRHFKIE